MSGTAWSISIAFILALAATAFVLRRSFLPRADSSASGASRFLWLVPFLWLGTNSTSAGDNGASGGEGGGSDGGGGGGE